MRDFKSTTMTFRRIVWFVAFGCFAIAGASGCSGPAEDDYELRGDCEEPRQFCDGVCVDTDADPSHCGSCDTSCGDGEVCADGDCAVSCPSGYLLCDGGCHDPETSTDHCGECGPSCGAGEVCDEGSCASSCGENLEACEGECRDTAVDPSHCGECGHECDVGEVCLAGSCETSCGGGQTSCDGVCRNLASDPDHCGECDNACPASFGCLDGDCHGIDDYPTVVDGLQLWLRPDRNMVTSGGGVDSWQNGADGDEVATVAGGASAPTVVDNVFDQAPAIRFDGGGDVLRVDDFAYPGQEMTHTVVFAPAHEIDETTDETMRLYDGDQTPTSTRMHMTLNDEGEGRMSLVALTQDEVDDRFETSTDRWYRDSPYIVTFRYDGNEMSVHVNGELEESGAFGGQIQWQEAFEFGDGFDGDLAEMAIFDRALEESELGSVHAYLSSRYGVYFDGAPWLDEYTDNQRQFIEDYELSRGQFEDRNFTAIPVADTCSDHLAEGRDQSGVYRVSFGGDDAPTYRVYCDMTSVDGGWTQIAHIRSHENAPYPGRDHIDVDPDELGHSIDADGFEFSEIALTHNGIDDEDFAAFELDESTTWDSSRQDLRFELDDGTYAIFSLSDAESPGCGDIPATCIGSDNDNCTNQDRDATFGAVSAGTGCCVELSRETSTTCGGWGAGSAAGDRTWTSAGGRLFLR